MSADQSSLVPENVAQLPTSIGGNDKDNNMKNESLCKQCQAIDWLNVPDWSKFKGSQSSTVCPNGRGTKSVCIFREKSRNQLLNSSCHVCRFVGHLINPNSGSYALTDPQDPHDEPLYVCLEACENLGRIRDSTEDSPLVKLAVRSPVTGSTRIHGDNHNDYIRFIIAHRFNNHETCGIRTIKPLEVHYNFLRQEIEDCVENHEECRSKRLEVEGLYVIDVATEQICRAPSNCEYAALSYVWDSCKKTEEPFPSVIKDAIAATKALGYKYLWVDRYMIGKMDQVYGTACITIIAASGSSAADGLPGISIQRNQCSIAIGDTRLVEVSNVGSDTIKLSTWASRGWTYQEAFLSKRRLIFTKNEVLFLCNKKLAKETVARRNVDPYNAINLGNEVSGSKVGDRESRIMKSFLWMISSIDRSAHWSLYEYIGQQIEEYSKRNLTEKNDRLNAYLGILKYYESNVSDKNGPLTHLEGIPLKLLENSEVYFDLSWKHQAIDCRRDGLPSWSWSGWGGPVQFFNLGTFQLHIQSPPADNHNQDGGAGFGDRTSVFLKLSFGVVYIASLRNFNRTYTRK